MRIDYFVHLIHQLHQFCILSFLTVFTYLINKQYLISNVDDDSYSWAGLFTLHLSVNYHFISVQYGEKYRYLIKYSFCFKWLALLSHSKKDPGFDSQPRPTGKLPVGENDEKYGCLSLFSPVMTSIGCISLLGMPARIDSIP